MNKKFLDEKHLYRDGIASLCDELGYEVDPQKAYEDLAEFLNGLNKDDRKAYIREVHNRVDRKEYGKLPTGEYYDYYKAVARDAVKIQKALSEGRNFAFEPTEGKIVYEEKVASVADEAENG